MFEASAKFYNPETGLVDLVQTYQARTRQEAINWLKFNRDYSREPRINGERVSV